MIYLIIRIIAILSKTFCFKNQTVSVREELSKMDISGELKTILKKYDALENESYWYDEQYTILKKNTRELLEEDKQLLDFEIELIPAGIDIWKEAIHDFDSILDVIKESCIKYYKFRIDTSNNLLHKGRYAFYLWRYFKKQKDKTHLDYFRIFYDNLLKYLEELTSISNPNSDMILISFQLLGQASKSLKLSKDFCKIVNLAASYTIDILTNGTINRKNIDICRYFASNFENCMKEMEYNSLITALKNYLNELEERDIRGLEYPEIFQVYGEIIKLEGNKIYKKIGSFHKIKGDQILKTEEKDKWFIALMNYENSMDFNY